MSEDIGRQVLSRPFKVDEIRDGASGEIAVTESELEAIAKMLDLAALHQLNFAYSFEHRGGGRLLLTGTLRAMLTQTCVISLEPIEARLEVPVEMEFWPAALMPHSERNAADPGTSGLLDWPEAIVEGRIDLGPVIYESLATALDPYPKREGARFRWAEDEGEEAETAKTGPFAALAALKQR
ncbi:MAG TPA: DUF177 domain-containing protein [Methyloceanibacter sp.]|jgi:hypothetical protein|nr:DUF177 domain-containing protein [Methyloceanibacter sp.]